jgi:O-antigen/teichoic acid export membrane protein
LKPFDSTGAFVVGPERGELRLLAVRGAGISVVGQALIFGVQMLATIILARLLTPTDFGIVTMVTTFSLLPASFGVTGFTDAILQRERIDHFLISNLFWINVGVGLVLSAMFASAGWLLVRFYGDPRLSAVALAMSVSIILTDLSVQHLALLKRAMRFYAVSVNDIIARSTSVIFSLTLAWMGWGYWALVVGGTMQVLSTSIGAWILCRWVPSLPRRGAGTRSMVRFALHAYGRFALSYGTHNIDNVLVGWRYGSSALGLYKKAYDLFILAANQLMSPLGDVAVSAMSRLKDDPGRYRAHFLMALSVLSFVGMGLGAELALVGNDLIFCLLGAKWVDAGRIFTFFGPGIGVMLLYSTHGWLHVSAGRPDRWFRWAMIELAVTGVLFIVALPFGPAAIALAWTISFWCLIFPAFQYAAKQTNLNLMAIVGATWKFALASVLAASIAVLIMTNSPALTIRSGTLGSMARIAAMSLLFATLYTVCVIALYRGCAPVRQFSRLVADMIPQDRRSPKSDPAIMGIHQEL